MELELLSTVVHFAHKIQLFIKCLVSSGELSVVELAVLFLCNRNSTVQRPLLK